jgi:predicted nucleotidyltransferase component of viral defense system
MANDILSVIKRRTISALVSDDIFMGILVLKGGNALDLAYDITSRGSIDIDFSIENDFTDQERDRMKNQSDYLLNKEFERENFKVFDVTFSEKPKKIHDSVKDFWGGYLLEFKIIELEKFNKYSGDIDRIRREAFSVGKKGSTKFKIDISKYEYTAKSKMRDLDGAVVQVYTPEMLCLEKLRAVCQQTDEYGRIILSMSIRPRARDFYDIINLCEHFDLDFSEPENIELAELIFEAKKVPLEFINLIPNYKDFHFGDWESVLQSLEQNAKIEPFDYYFDLVVERFSHLCR